MSDPRQYGLLPCKLQGGVNHESTGKRPYLVRINRVLHVVDIHTPDPESSVRHRRTFSPHLSISPVNEPCAGCQRMSPAAPLLPGHAGHGLVVFQLCGRCVVCGRCRVSILAGLAGMQG